MALGTKGVTLRLSNSSDLLETQSSVISILTSIGGRSRVASIDTAIVDFVALGYLSNMRIVTNSINNTSIYTALSVLTSSITVKGSSDVMNGDLSTTILITGHTMEEIGEIVSIDGPAGSVNVMFFGLTLKMNSIGSSSPYAIFQNFELDLKPGIVPAMSSVCTNASAYSP